MKRKKARAEKASAGTTLAARMRAEANKLTDADREKLGEAFLKLYYGADHKPVVAPVVATSREIARKFFQG